MAEQSRAPAGSAKPASREGQRTFASACASCHGLDGRGGERAPDIAQAAAVQHLSDKELLRIVGEGVPGTGMPAFRSLGSTGVNAVVKYLRLLQGRDQLSQLPGNASTGQALFFGSSGCSSCHMMAGQGGFLASDLSSYGRNHSIDEIRQAILNPERDPGVQGKRAVVTTHDGNRYDGLIRNQDNFSIQLQAMDGTYHFIDKSDVKNIDYLAAPIMPSYATKLSSRNLNDILSYLMVAARNSNTEAAPADEN